LLDPTWWAPGLTLAERSGGSPAPAAGAAERAERRLDRWRDVYWFPGLDRMAGLLGGDGLDAAGLRALLAEPPAELAARSARPDWSREVESIVAQPGTPAAGGLAAIVAPFVRRTVDRLADAPELLTQLATSLAGTLAMLAGRTLALELHVLRVTGRLAGDTPSERFESFVRQLAGGDGLAWLLAEYPVLARLLVQAGDRALAGWTLLLRRLAADRASIVDTVFGGADPGSVAAVEFVGAYRHDQLRSVAVLSFAGGARLVYRPHPCRGFSCFREVAGWLGRRLPGLELHTPAVVDRGAYGWVEFVPHLAPASPADRERLHHRWGALLALCHALGVAELRDGDVVVHGDRPVPVDLTGLFQPGQADADDPAGAALDSSIHRLELLPAPAGDDRAPEDRWPAYPYLQWIEPGTDQMRLVRRTPAGPVASARPAGSLATALLSGFATAYDGIAAGRDELIGTGGLLWRFHDLERRVRTRPAEGYGALLADSVHPDGMRDALERDRLLGRILSDSWGDGVFAAELAALRDGTIPQFTGRVGARDLVGTVLPRTGLDRAAGVIRAMDGRDRETQVWIIRTWLAQPGPEAGGTAAPARMEERCLMLARQLADRLADSAYHRRERSNWLGLTTLDERRWLVRPLGVGLSDGYPGVALFLAKLAELTGEERYATLARRAVAHVPALLENYPGPAMPGEAVRPGPFLGVTGLAYALVHIAASLDDPGMLEPVLSPLAATAMAAPDGGPDVASGFAGCAAAMLAVDAAVGFAPARRVAQSAVARLVGRPAPHEPVGFARGGSGIGWALLRSATATGQSQAVEAGLAAFGRERSAGFPDRPGWCDGMAGIGLARADCTDTGDPALAADLDRAVAAVVEAGPRADHSLCHGELGCLELLAQVPGRTHWRCRTTALLDTLERSGPRSGTPGGVPTPGLLTGLAGIGYGLLRLGFPDRVPSVLLLRPPAKGVPR
jgi:class II lanthipeptide synthase